MQTIMEKMQFEIITYICFRITLFLHSFPTEYSLWAPRPPVLLPLFCITLFHLNEKSSPYFDFNTNGSICVWFVCTFKNWYTSVTLKTWTCWSERALDNSACQ